MTKNLEKTKFWWSKLKAAKKLELIEIYFPLNKFKRDIDSICTDEQLEDIYQKVLETGGVKV